MTLLAPGFFIAALAASAVVIAFHFIVTRQPRAGILPTARFVPDLPATATARAARPSDLLLLLVRVLLLLAAGAGLARPVLKPSRTADARVILVDASRAVRNVAEIRDSASAVYRRGDAVIVFDSTARHVGGSIADTLRELSPRPATGNLSAALIAALRAGSALRDAADSMDLVIVSPVASDEIDTATDSIRRLWPGKARLIRVGASTDAPDRISSPLEIRTVPGDPLAVTASLARNRSTEGGVIQRSVGSTADSAAIVSAGRALIVWPMTGRPVGASPRNPIDTIGGIIARDRAVIAGFQRSWRFDSDSLNGGEVVARWVDGEPAALEWAAGTGCVRSVVIPVPSVGDLPIREDFVRLLLELGSSCRLQKPVEPAPAVALASHAGGGGLAPRSGFQPRDDQKSSLAPWLIGLAIVASVAEVLLRRRSNVAITARRMVVG